MAANKPYDILFRLMVVGDSNVGKSSFLDRYCDDIFYQDRPFFKLSTVIVGKLVIKLQIWDVPGDPRFRNFNQSYYRNANGVILMYDQTCAESLNSLDFFWDQVQNLSSKDVAVVIVGTKSDLVDKIQVNAAEVRQLANQKRVPFYEISSKTGANLQEMVFELLSNYLKATLNATPAMSRADNAESDKCILS
eukprot:TRINITY_DN2009_c0_g1_i7.p1 TRINITY_DN2009_c0_g1~~TRINITY_DN2009_c0_g1_i7.p1  ORF type:complete len:192 (+),score=11.80 TRINITY_DN2009_c0_g1_i7:44-619(+)